LPFDYDYFYQEEPKMAFAILTNHYNIALKEAQKIIDLGRMFCNEELISVKNAKISGNIKVLKFIPKSKNLKPIFKTDKFIVFDKPSGVLVHPKAVLTDYSLLDEIRTFGTNVSNPAHRIDKETSGLVIAGINKKDEILLKQMFEQKKIQKRYLAWVKGNTKDYFEVKESIKIRDDYSKNKHKVEINPKGKKAHTEFKKLYYNAKLDVTLVEATPYTGRTHQIRIHLFHVKHPIVGDPLYGVDFNVASDYLDGKLTIADRVKYTGAKRLLLHANSLEFELNNNRYIIKSLQELKFENIDFKI